MSCLFWSLELWKFAFVTIGLPTMFEEIQRSHLGVFFTQDCSKKIYLTVTLTCYPHSLIDPDIPIIPVDVPYQINISSWSYSRKHFLLNFTSDLLFRGSVRHKILSCSTFLPSLRKISQTILGEVLTQNCWCNIQTPTQTPSFWSPPPRYGLPVTLGYPQWVTPQETLLRNKNDYHSNCCYGNRDSCKCLNWSTNYSVSSSLWERCHNNANNKIKSQFILSPMISRPCLFPCPISTYR